MLSILSAHLQQGRKARDVLPVENPGFQARRKINPGNTLQKLVVTLVWS
jgi:hypothetical protein